jgi:hypothetical protein
MPVLVGVPGRDTSTQIRWNLHWNQTNSTGTDELVRPAATISSTSSKLPSANDGSEYHSLCRTFSLWLSRAVDGILTNIKSGPDPVATSITLAPGQLSNTEGMQLGNRETKQEGRVS